MNTHLRAVIALSCWGFGSAACAMNKQMPPFSTSLEAAHAPAPPDTVTAQLRALGSPSSGHLGQTERDGATGQTRVSLVTHEGSHFLWTASPRVTFFYVYAGSSLEHPPAIVFLVFQTSGEVVGNNRLNLSCNKAPVGELRPANFDFQNGVGVSNKVYTYELPLATFIPFARCDAAALQVGDYDVSFDKKQMQDLRAFAAGMSGGTH